MKKDIKNLNQAKEQWASRHDKTWSDIQRDLEYGNGVSKIYSTEEVMDRVCEIYTNIETAALRKEVEELRECFKDLHIFCLENGEVVNGFRSKEIIQKSKNLLK